MLPVPGILLLAQLLTRLACILLLPQHLLLCPGFQLCWPEQLHKKGAARIVRNKKYGHRYCLAAKRAHTHESTADHLTAETTTWRFSWPP
jgi:hypothetical protein